MQKNDMTNSSLAHLVTHACTTTRRLGLAQVAHKRGWRLRMNGVHGARSSGTSSGELYVTSDPASLPQACHMLLYLTRRTWTRGDESAALADELMKVMARREDTCHDSTWCGLVRLDLACSLA